MMNTVHKRVSDLNEGESGIVCGLLDEGDVAIRLQEMGILKGTFLEVIRRAPMGGPVEIKVKGYRLSLRVNEAALVEVAP